MSKLLRKLFINLLLIFTIIINTQTIPVDWYATDLSTVMMIEKHGYTAEVHEVHTQDGYILELHRIPKSRDGKAHTKNHPVLIPHCLLGSSADWILGGPDRSLPMQLADDGFDVWLANYRGNTYSRRHETLSDMNNDFWNFSLHELGIYDLPAIIDYILKTTNTQQIHYIGFSMGTTTFFIMTSEKPEYQEKIRTNISLAPVANIYHSTSILKTLGPMPKRMDTLNHLVGHGKFLVHSRHIASFTNTICDAKYQTIQHICLKMIIFTTCGYDDHSFDQALFPLILGHIPAGTSSKLIVHFSQFINSDTFGQYDYGEELNLQHYKSDEPPSYYLDSIHVPIYVFYGENDLLATTKDVENLLSELPNVKKVIKVDNKYFNHLDFIFSKTVTFEINDPVKEILQKTDIEN